MKKMFILIILALAVFAGFIFIANKEHFQNNICELRGPRSGKDPTGLISAAEWKNAIKYVQEKYPKTIFEDIWKNLQTGNAKWWIDFNANGGRDVRNELRQNGFSWGQSSLESNWVVLMEDASRDMLCKKE